jgi:hypothetical protein
MNYKPKLLPAAIAALLSVSCVGYGQLPPVYNASSNRPAKSGIAGTAPASNDMTFVIDPGFLSDHSGFKLVLNPNLDLPPPNPNPVPEPSGWGMIAGALALFFVGMRFCRGNQKLPRA